MKLSLALLACALAGLARPTGPAPAGPAPTGLLHASLVRGAVRAEPDGGNRTAEAWSRSWTHFMPAVGHDKFATGQCSIDPNHPVVLPENMPCPSRCPFPVQLPFGKCTKACVPAGHCADFNPGLPFGNPETMKCEPPCGTREEDKVLGCLHCAEPGKCDQCLPGWEVFGVELFGFELSRDGKTCRSNFQFAMLLFYAFFLIIGLILAGRLLSIWLRTPLPEQQEVLREAEEHRRRCKPRRSNGEPYPFFSTNVFTENICGMGVPQYFTWNVWFMVAALCLSLGTYFAHMEQGKDEELVDALDDVACRATSVNMSAMNMTNVTLLQTLAAPDPADAPAVLGADSGLRHFFPMERRMFRFLWPAYLAVMVLALTISYYQERTTRKWDKHRLWHFAVMVRNLPADAVDCEALTEHLRPHCTKLKGVSIAYEAGKVQGQLEAISDEWQAGKSRVVQDFEGKYDVEAFLVDVGPREHDDPTAVLSELTCAGDAIAVFETQQAAMDLVKTYKSVPPFMGNTLTVQKIHCSPTGVLWQNFNRGSVFVKILQATGLFVFIWFLWLSFFVPYVLDVMHVASVPGEHTNAYADLILGAFMAIGNCIIAYAAEIVTDYAGCRFNHMRQVIVMVLGFFCVLINTFIDIFVVVQLSQGASLNAAFEGTRVGVQNELVEGIFTLIMPSYLFIPYFGMPIGIYMVPYYLNKWIIRSRPVELGAAKRAMVAADLDLVSRYYDYANNFSICIFILIFNSKYTYLTMLALFGSLLFLHVLDKYMMLKVASKTYYRNPALGRWFSRILVVPTGFLALITVWWGCKAGYFLELTDWMGISRGAEDNMQEQLDWLDVLGLDFHVDWAIPMVFALLVHFTVYIVILEACRVPAEVVELTYDQVREKLRQKERLEADYWNTNLALCLRHKYLKTPVPGAESLVPFEHKQDETPSPSARKGIPGASST